MYGQPAARSLQPQPPVNSVHKMPVPKMPVPVASNIPSNIPGSYPVHPDVRLKKLPFYEMRGELLKPSTLSKLCIYYDFNHLNFFGVCVFSFFLLYILLFALFAVPQGSTRMQENNFVFHLTPHQATEIAMSRDIGHGAKNEYLVQVRKTLNLMANL